MENNEHHQLPPPSYLPPPPSPPPPPPPYSREMRNYRIAQTVTASDVRVNQFPKSRIKKIMKSDPEVEMVTAEAPIVLSKAIEMLIVDLTMQSWVHAMDNRRNTLLRSDISRAVTNSLDFSFLVDVVPRAEPDLGFVATPHQDGGGVLPQGMAMGHPMVDGDGMYVPPPGEGEEAAGEIGGSSGGD